MTSSINFVELENRIISATYRNLMVRAKVVLVEKESGIGRAGHHHHLDHAGWQPSDQASRGNQDLFPSGAQCAWEGHRPQRRILRRLTN
jgi:hypothetical protein